jgi:hypothetical protein
VDPPANVLAANVDQLILAVQAANVKIALLDLRNNPVAALHSLLALHILDKLNNNEVSVKDEMLANSRQFATCIHNCSNLPLLSFFRLPGAYYIHYVKIVYFVARCI